jgi:Uma2 family endonuclease
MTGHQHTDEARASGRKLTYRDFLKFPDDGRRHELIDGKHYVTAAPNMWHQRLSMRLTKALLDYLESHPVGELFAAPFDVVMTNIDVVEPDLLLVTNDQADQLNLKNLRGAPSLVIEMTSPSTSRLDRRLKRDLYARRGVREYWMVDHEAASIAVFRHAADGGFPLVDALLASDSAALTTPLLPGFSLPLPALFRS